MFIVVHGASEGFRLELERRFGGTELAADGAPSLRVGEDADEAWARARAVLAFSFERGALDVCVHVTASQVEAAPPAVAGMVLLALLSGRALDHEDFPLASKHEWRALSRTDLFVARSDGALVFRERHVEESLAAGRLCALPVRALQRLLTDDEGALRDEATGLVEPPSQIRPELAGPLERWRASRSAPRVVVARQAAPRSRDMATCRDGPVLE